MSTTHSTRSRHTACAAHTACTTRPVTYRSHVEKARHDLSDPLHARGHQQAVNQGPCQCAWSPIGQRKAPEGAAAPAKLVHLSMLLVVSIGDGQHTPLRAAHTVAHARPSLPPHKTSHPTLSPHHPPPTSSADVLKNSAGPAHTQLSTCTWCSMGLFDARSRSSPSSTTSRSVVTTAPRHEWSTVP